MFVSSGGGGGVMGLNASSSGVGVPRWGISLFLIFNCDVDSN